MRNAPRIRRQSSLLEKGRTETNDSDTDEDNGKSKADPGNWTNHRSSLAFLPRDHDSRMLLIDSTANAWLRKPEYASMLGTQDNINDSYRRQLDASDRRRRQTKTAVFLIFFPLLIWMSWNSFIIPVIQEATLYFHTPNPNQGKYGVQAPIHFNNSLIKLQTLDPTHLPNHLHLSSRLVIVGDVHGCKDELVRLLNKVDFSPKRDHLILAGDMIDKGPNSNGVIKLARRLGASCVRGNHEDRMLLEYEAMSDADLALIPDDDEEIDNELADLEIAKLLKAERSAATERTPDEKDAIAAPYRRLVQAPVGKRALHTDPSSFSKASLTYLTHCPVILRVGNISSLPGEVTVVHAGLAPNVPLANQDPYAVMTMRTIDYKSGVPSSERDGKGLMPWWRVWGSEQRRLSPSASGNVEEIGQGEEDDGWVNIDKKHKNKHKMPRRLVVYGHDSKTGLNVQKYSVGLDSGCVKGGKLSSLVIGMDKKGRAMQKVVSVGCRSYV